MPSVDKQSISLCATFPYKLIPFLVLIEKQSIEQKKVVMIPMVLAFLQLDTK